MDSHFSSVEAEPLPEDNDGTAEYIAIYNVFKKFLENYGNTQDRWDLLEEMMSLRAEFAMNQAISGFGLDFEKALEILRGHNDGLTKQEREQKEILLAALDNLVDFAVAEEFQMSEALPGDIDMEDEECLEECESVFDLYNNVYTSIENGDIHYAMSVAAAWVNFRDNTVLTFMTQGDERVRPWHLALEGLSYTKSSFPAWLIPPIEHNCRCYLVEDSVLGTGSQLLNVEAAVQTKQPDEMNHTFDESVCRGGRIFGPAHPYFQVPKKYKKRLKTIASKIKDKWMQKE